MYSSTPGNQVALNFVLAKNRNYTFTANVTSVGFGSPGDVRLQRFDGLTWQYISTTLFLPGAQGTVNANGVLAPGDYRLLSNVGFSVLNGVSRTGTYSMQLDMLPNDVTVSGTVNLLDYVGNIAAETVDFEIRRNNGTLVETIPNVPLNASGNFSFTTAFKGTNLRVTARGRTWVRKQNSALALVTGQTTNVNISCPNGDADQSGEVDAVDIDLVIAHFGEVDGGGPYFQNADLDGSGEVDAVDIDVAIANFGATNDY